jgi:hypothetical protein
MNSLVTNMSAPSLVKKSFDETLLGLIFRCLFTAARAVDIQSDLGMCAITKDHMWSSCRAGYDSCTREVILTVAIMTATFLDWAASIVMTAAKPAKPGQGSAASPGTRWICWARQEAAALKFRALTELMGWTCTGGVKQPTFSLQSPSHVR